MRTWLVGDGPRTAVPSPWSGVWLRHTGSLLRRGLVDEIRLVVNPVLLGAGRRPFDGLEVQPRLRLLRSEAFRSGNVLLCYAVDPPTGGRPT